MRVNAQDVIEMLAGVPKRMMPAKQYLNNISTYLIYHKDSDWDKIETQKRRGTIYLKIKQETGKAKNFPYYFRYRESDDIDEGCGFYGYTNRKNKYGDYVYYMNPDKFWEAMTVIMNWLPQVIDMSIENAPRHPSQDRV